MSNDMLTRAQFVERVRRGEPQAAVIDLAVTDAARPVEGVPE